MLEYKLREHAASDAGEALATFMEVTGAEPESAVRDLLADLMHYCVIKGLDFEDELRAARNNYAEETQA